MLADACNLACGAYYDEDHNSWVESEEWPVLFISTELDLRELQTMALAFVTNIDEELILRKEVSFSDPRIVRGLQVLKTAPLYLEVLPDFTVKDVENTIKRNIRINRVHYVFN